MLAPPCQPSEYFCHEFLSSGTANKEAVNSQIPSPVAEGIVKSQSAGILSVCSDLVTSFILGQRLDFYLSSHYTDETSAGIC